MSESEKTQVHLLTWTASIVDVIHFFTFSPFSRSFLSSITLLMALTTASQVTAELNQVIS